MPPLEEKPFRSDEESVDDTGPVHKGTLAEAQRRARAVEDRLRR